MRYNKLALEVCNLLSNAHDIIQSLLVVDLALVEGALLNLDLLVEEGELFISFDELCAEDVSLVDDDLGVLLLLLLF